MTRVLVTGGAGYIGSHVVRALQQAGFEPIVLDNLVYGHSHIVKDILKVPLVVGQVGDRKLLDSILAGQHKDALGAPVSAVLHFAAYTYVGESVVNPAIYYRNNLGDTLVLLEAIIDSRNYRNKKDLKKSLIPLVFSSTCSTYGIPSNDDIPIKESTSQAPINPYGRSKLMIEQLIKDFYEAYALPSTILRYFNAAGADPSSDLGENHNPETHLIPLVLEAASKRTKSVKVFGNDYPTFDGTCIRDYIHVSDLANAHVLALKQLFDKRGLHIYNLGTGKGYSVREVIDIASTVTGQEINIEEYPRREGDPPILVASPRKAELELGWRPIYGDLESIIKHAWDWTESIQK